MQFQEYYKEIKTEREKLNRLIDEALASGTPIAETYDIMDQCKKMKRVASEALRSEAVCAQSRRVDQLIERGERE